MVGAAIGLGSGPCPAAAQQPDGATGTPPSAPAHVEPFVQGIPGTTVEIAMTPIPAGTLEVADPDNPDATITVEIAPFYMSTTEITWDVYDVFVFALDQPDPTRPDDADVISRPSKPYLPPDRGFGHAGYAALSMTHHAAEQFCVWLSAKTGRTYRLATEDEWEYACRAGSTGLYSFGDDAQSLSAHAWFEDNAQWTTHPVGKLEANTFGLFDMHGNAAEWIDGRDGTPLVAGGSFLDPADQVTAASRQRQTRAWQASEPQIPRSKWWLSDATHVGFRIVCE